VCPNHQVEVSVTIMLIFGLLHSFLNEKDHNCLCNQYRKYIQFATCETMTMHLHQHFTLSNGAKGRTKVTHCIHDALLYMLWCTLTVKIIKPVASAIFPRLEGLLCLPLPALLEGTSNRNDSLKCYCIYR